MNKTLKSTCKRAWESWEPISPSGVCKPSDRSGLVGSNTGASECRSQQVPPFPKVGGSSVSSQWLPNRNADGSVKNSHEMQENPVQSLLQKDPLEKEMATHPSILAWKTPWTGEPGGLLSIAPQTWTQLGNQTTAARARRFIWFFKRNQNF